VNGLLKRKTEDEKNYIDVIVSEMDRIGYNRAYQVCHSIQYKVPQLRKRLIIVDVCKDLNFTYPMLVTVTEIKKTIEKNVCILLGY